MNLDLIRFRWKFIPAFLLIGSVLGVLASGCGGDEEPAAPEVPVAPEAPESERVPEEQAAVYPGVDAAAVTPVTLPALALMPVEAQVAVALPPVSSLIDTYMPLALALADPSDDVEVEQAEAIQQAASELGVEADSWESLTAALGADPNAPAAVFIDFTRLVKSAVAEKARKEGTTGASGTAPLGGSEPSSDEATGEPSMPADYFENAEQPDWAVALGVTDPEKARSAVERIAGEDEALSQLAAGTEVVEGVLISTRGEEWGAFTTNRHIVLGSLPLVRGAAKRVKDPATYRYGTVECPPRVADEAVMIAHGNRIMPVWKEALPLMEVEGGGAALAAAQLATYENIFSKAGEDPMVLTASLVDGVFEIVSKADTATHAGLVELMGAPSPVELARLLPEGTQAMITMRLNEQTKKQFSEQAVPAAAASGDPAAVQGATMAAQFITMLGDEVTLGVGAGDGMLPAANAFVELADPNTARSLMAFVPMEAGPEIEGYTFGQVAPAPMVSILIGIVDNMLVASTSESQLKTIIARHKAGEVSPLFGAMDPPIAIDTPIYQTFVANTALIEQVQGLVGAFSGGSAAPDPAFQRIVNAIREVRVVQGMEDTWFTGRFTVYLKDLEAALAASKAAATAATEAGSSEASAPEVQ